MKYLKQTKYMVGRDLFIPKNISLKFQRGACLSPIRDSKTIHIKGNIVSGPNVIFLKGLSFDIYNNNVLAHWFEGIDLGESINRASSSLVHGGSINVVKLGRYNINTPIKLRGGQSLIGTLPGGNNDLASPDNVPIAFVYSGKDTFITLGGLYGYEDSQFIQGITFYGFEYDRRPTNYTRTCIGIGGSGTTRKVNIERCEFFYWDIGIDLNKISSRTGQVSKIMHNTFRRMNTAIKMDGSDHVTIYDNRIIDCVDSWINIGDSCTYSIWIDHNNCANSSQYFGDGIIIGCGDQVNITFNHMETHVSKYGSRCIKLGNSSAILSVNIIGNFMNFYGQECGVDLNGIITGLYLFGNDFHGMQSPQTKAGINHQAILSNATAIANQTYGSNDKPLIADSTNDWNSKEDGFKILDNGGYSDTIGLHHITYQPLERSPTEPIVGMTIYADGKNWDPGEGEGLYVVTSEGYEKLNKEK